MRKHPPLHKAGRMGAAPYLSLHTNHYPLNKKYPPNLGEYFCIVLVCLRFGYVNFEHRRDNLRLRRDVSAACQIISFFSQPDSAEMVKNAAKNHAMIFVLSFCLSFLLNVSERRLSLSRVIFAALIFADCGNITYRINSALFLNALTDRRICLSVRVIVC